MLQNAARIFGAVILLVGIMGFIPAFVEDGHLLGVFHVDALHNIIHIATGLAALVFSGSAASARVFFQVFTVIYGLITIAGFMPGLVNDDEELLGLLHINMADNWLHLGITAITGYFGFVHKDPADERPAAPAA